MRERLPGKGGNNDQLSITGKGFEMLHKEGAINTHGNYSFH
jgi:hypothetical protein